MTLKTFFPPGTYKLCTISTSSEHWHYA